ncbi:aldose 1-epimerase [Streptomyces sp. DvalAA-14]|uniref:aldose epimerase family protein n=1 Tax=unclassified Streptomyces TaxID=2593676 RepID=UPI00081BA2D7|nr:MULTISPECIES: aldose epimerase family protein [unclassified Streptomyces]MYS24178.1 galactose-1-epimerase [Streptomyces sp. SID4948]SCE43431.1 aldose 1-epimerase [Streptomyces sp. DvalAA-14]
MPTVSRSVAGTLPDGRTVDRWRLATAGGISVDTLTLGASLHAVRCPDAGGRVADVVLSPSRLEDKLGPARYFGATIGRYANRIAHGLLPTADGTVRLGSNEGGTTLHGGPEGFDTRLWAARAITGGGRSGVEFHLVSRDGDQGFPGTVEVTVGYTLGEDGALRIDYAAASDAPTVVNLTNHTYWNLAGGTDDTILDHELRVAADHFLPVDAELIPLPGRPRAVLGTPFDLTEPRRLRDVLGAADEQLGLASGGLDHNWVLRRPGGGAPELATVLHHAATGRRLECLTTEPGVQIYTGNQFSGTGAEPAVFSPVRYGAVAIETQHFPDSPRRPDYPSVWLRPGADYRSTTVFRLSTDGATRPPAGRPWSSGCVRDTDDFSSV